MNGEYESRSTSERLSLTSNKMKFPDLKLEAPISATGCGVAPSLSGGSPTRQSRNTATFRSLNSIAALFWLELVSTTAGIASFKSRTSPDSAEFAVSVKSLAIRTLGVQNTRLSTH